MRRFYPLVFLLGLSMAFSARAGEDGFLIRRIRLVPNPAPGEISGGEVLEVNFGVSRRGWVPGFGWTLRGYSAGGSFVGQEGTAYFLSGQTPRNRLAPGRIKGPGEFSAFFAVPEGSEVLILVLGDPGRLTYRMLPSNRLVEEFRVSVPEVRNEIARSRFAWAGSSRRD